MRGVGLVFPEASVMDEEKRREKERKKNWGRGGEDIELGHWYRESIQVSFLPFPPRIIKRANATIPPPPPPPFEGREPALCK